LTALLVVVGFAGLLLPAVPGIPLVFVGLVLLAWADDFAYVGWITLTLLGVLALLSYGVDLRPRRNKVRRESGAGGNRRGAGTLTAFEDATRSGGSMRAGSGWNAEKVGILYNYWHRHLQANLSRLE